MLTWTAEINAFQQTVIAGTVQNVYTEECLRHYEGMVNKICNEDIEFRQQQ